MKTRESRRTIARGALRAQPDRRLVTLASAGNDAALEEIVRRYRPALVRYAASIVPPDRADDVVQDSLTRALPGIRSGQAELNLRAWLYTIVRNASLNDLRDAGPPAQELDENYDGVEQPPHVIERREQLRSLIAGLGTLPEAQREALIRREMEGLSHASIGEQLGVSTGAARQLIHRARIALRDGIGSLVPLPLLRQLLDVEGGGGVAAVGGSGAVAVKATAAVLAAGAVVTAGVVLKDSHPHAQRAPVLALRSRSRDQAPESSARGARRDHPPGNRPNPAPAHGSSGEMAAARGAGSKLGGVATVAARHAPFSGAKGGGDSRSGGPGRGAVGGSGPRGGQSQGQNPGVGGSDGGSSEVGGSRVGTELAPPPAAEVTEPAPSGGSTPLAQPSEDRNRGGENQASDSSGSDDGGAHGDEAGGGESSPAGGSGSDSGTNPEPDGPPPNQGSGN